MDNPKRVVRNEMEDGFRNGTPKLDLTLFNRKEKLKYTMRLRASQLTKDFGHRTIVKNATLSVHPGEVVTIFGPNGAGKTTLIKILATLLKPTSGKLEIEGTDAIADYSDVRRALGVVIHENLAYPSFSPYENLSFSGRCMALSS